MFLGWVCARAWKAALGSGRFVHPVHTLQPFLRGHVLFPQKREAINHYGFKVMVCSPTQGVGTTLSPSVHSLSN